MTNKILIYKLEYDNVNEVSIPNFNPEEIGYILLTVEKGFIKTPDEFGPFQVPLFEGKKYELKQFPVNFRNIMEGTRQDITYLYKLKTAVYDEDYNEIIGYNIDNDIQKIDIVSFFTKIKDSKNEQRIYQIRGRYTESTEEARAFWEQIKSEPKEDVLKKLEEIKANKTFQKYPLEKKLFYLNKLRDKYRELQDDKMYWKMQREIESSIGERIDKRKKLSSKDTEINKNPFNISLDKFKFLEKEGSQAQRTKSLLYKSELGESHKLPDITIDNIADILINIEMINDYVDSEEKVHAVNFRGIIDETRKDIVFHYVDFVPIFDPEKIDENGVALLIGHKAELITNVDIVSFIKKNKEGKKEHRIYQIGRRYRPKNLTADDIYGLGGANYELNNFTKALEFFDCALAIDPNDVDVLVYKGLTLVCLEQFDEAIELYKQALQSEPDDPIIWDNLAIAHEKQDDKENAIKAIRKAFDLDPEDEEIKEHYYELNLKDRKNKIK